VLYTYWHRKGFKFVHNITWKNSGKVEGNAEFSLGIFTYLFLLYFGKKGTLDNMIAKNVNRIAEGIKNGNLS
jgi:hypothetical protein